MNFITDDFYLAVEYNFKEKEEVLKYLESLKPDCKCDWSDGDNCDECFRLEYLFGGVSRYSDYKINTCITWLRGFSDQFCVEEGYYLDSEKFKEDFKRAKDLHFETLKQLEFVETKLKSLGISYYVEDWDRVFVNAPLEFAREMDREVKTKFDYNCIWVYSNYPRIIGDWILKD